MMLKPGSLLYYATRWSSTPTQLLYTLYDILSQLPSSSQEPEIRAHKLQFWHSDLTRFFQKDSPQHPLLQAWQQHPSLTTLPQAPFWNLIESIQWECEGGTFETEDDQQQFLKLKGGSLGKLVAALNNASPQGSLLAEQLGVITQALTQLQYLGRDLRRGFCFLPYASHHLAFSGLIAPKKPSPEWQDYLSTLLQQWQQEAKQISTALTLNDAVCLKSLTTQWLLTYKSLTHLQKDGFPVYHYSYHLPPTQLLWWAFRNKRTTSVCKLF